MPLRDDHHESLEQPHALKWVPSVTLPTSEAGLATAPSSAILRERVEFWLQEQRSGAWLDYACKDSAEICARRKIELTTEKPERIFRCIIRVITDHELTSNSKLSDRP